MHIPAAGVQRARLLLDIHAHNIANANTEGHGGDLAADVVGVIAASHAYAANARAFAITADTERSLLDVLA